MKENNNSFLGYKIAIDEDLNLVMVVLEINEDDVLSNPEKRVAYDEDQKKCLGSTVDVILNLKYITISSASNKYIMALRKDHSGEVIGAVINDTDTKINKFTARNIFEDFCFRPIEMFCGALKCRSRSAKVVDIISLRNPEEHVSKAYSLWEYANIGYWNESSINKKCLAYVPDLRYSTAISGCDELPCYICAPGIHYFTNPYVAIMYALTGAGCLINEDIRKVNADVLYSNPGCPTYDPYEINFETLERWGELYEREDLDNRDDS